MRKIALAIGLIMLAGAAVAQTNVWADRHQPAQQAYRSTPGPAPRHQHGHHHHRPHWQHQQPPVYYVQPQPIYIAPPVQYQRQPRCFDYYDQFRQVWVQC